MARLRRMVTESPSRLFEREDVVREYAGFSGLKEAEPAILERVRQLGGGASLLDLGVGGGRTTEHFAPVVERYVGVDPSPAMIAACRRRFASRAWPHVELVVGDARDLSGFGAESFDVVLFSWNGLDEVGGARDRVQALREIQRVCRRGGVFAFSAHNLNWLLPRLSIASALRGRQSRPRARAVLRAAMLRLLNPSPSRLAQGRGALIADERRGMKWTRRYYVTPREQLRQLREVGFHDPVALSPTGTELSEDEAAADTRHWLYYLCTK